MEAALSQIRELAAQGEDSRWNVMVALRDLACSLEEPNDTIHRFGQMVRPTFIPKAAQELTHVEF